MCLDALGFSKVADATLDGMPTQFILEPKPSLWQDLSAMFRVCGLKRDAVVPFHSWLVMG
ncbi:MAG TPA: hypothetical protein VI432_00670 [Candidatus Paceibacterota bacterium]